MGKRFFILTLVLSLLGIYHTSYARVEYEGYIVAFCDNYIPDDDDLELICADLNVYYAKDNDFSMADKAHIEEIEPNIVIDLVDDIRTFSETDSEDYSSYQPEMKAMNPMAFWNIGAYGDGIRVAVIDTGYYTSKDTASNVLTGKNYFDNTTNVTDDVGHGTHVTGIIASSITDNYGIYGISPNVKVVPLKCFANKKSTTINMLVNAIDDAVNVYSCDVINMSWGMTSKSSILSNVLENAYNKGVILVAAAGNDSNTRKFYPASYSTVISVASVDANKAHSTFSQVNDAIFISAYGENILSTYTEGHYAYMSGTSQATPAISGFCALCKGVDKSLTTAKMMELLKISCDDLGTAGYDTTYGYGLINGEKLKNNLLASFVNVNDNTITIDNKTNSILGFRINLSENQFLTIPVSKNGTRELTVDCSGQDYSFSLSDSNYQDENVSAEGVISVVDENSVLSEISENSCKLSDCLGKTVNFYFWNSINEMKPTSNKVSIGIN